MTSNRSFAAILLSLTLLPTLAVAESPEGRVEMVREPDPPTAPARVELAHPFAAMAGAWSGGGTISLTGEINEKLRCRANHTFTQSSTSLSLSIRCASDNYKFELTSNVTERRGQISGQWQEANYGVTGTISGRMSGNRVTAVATGDKFTADLTVTTTGNRQSVTIVPKATYLQNVDIGLARQAPAPKAAAAAPKPKP